MYSASSYHLTKTDRDKYASKIIVPIYKYLDIDSTNRDRTNYLNPANFVLPLTYPGKTSDLATSVDPIVNSTPYTGATPPTSLIGTSTDGGLVSITLAATEPATDGFYVGSILVIAGQSRIISAYVGATKVATVALAYSPAVGAGPFSYLIQPPPLTGTSTDGGLVTIVLAASEPTINNFYIGNVLEIAGQFRTISSYNGTTKVAIVSTAYSPAVGAGPFAYFTRRTQPFFVGAVTGVTTPTTTVFSINGGASTVSGIYVNSYVRFTSGLNLNISRRVSAYDGPTKTVTVSSPFPSAPSVADAMEFGSFTRDNASTLIKTTNVAQQTASFGYYEIELLWLSLPNKVLAVGNGGTIDRYPYVYVKLFNEGNPGVQQILYSNNPSSASVLFKVPVDEYFGDTSFITLTNSKSKQVVNFNTDLDVRFTVTIPDGTIVSFAEADNVSPLPPDPFLQVNALFSLRKVS